MMFFLRCSAIYLNLGASDVDEGSAFPKQMTDQKTAKGASLLPMAPPSTPIDEIIGNGDLNALQVNPRQFRLMSPVGDQPELAILDRQITFQAISRSDGTLDIVKGALFETVKTLICRLPAVTKKSIAQLTVVDIHMLNSKQVTKHTLVQFGAALLPLQQKLYNGTVHKKCEWLLGRRSVEVMDAPSVRGLERRLMQIRNCAFSKVSRVSVLVLDLVSDLRIFFPPTSNSIAAASTATVSRPIVSKEEDLPSLISQLKEKANSSSHNRQVILQCLRQALLDLSPPLRRARLLSLPPPPLPPTFSPTGNPCLLPFLSSAFPEHPQPPVRLAPANSSDCSTAIFSMHGSTSF